MSSLSRTERSHRALAAIIAFGALLGGCSDIYYDRRETVALGADDHIAAGQRMQAAVERYRHNRVIPPVNATTTSMTQQQATQQAASANTATTQTTTQGAPAAPVR